MKLTYITLKGEQYPMCYNLYAVEALCEEFGELDNMFSSINKGSTAEQIKAISKILKILMAGGRAYCEEMGISMPAPIKNPAALIDITSPDTVKCIFSTINNDSEREVEAVSKNAVPTPES